MEPINPWVDSKTWVSVISVLIALMACLASWNSAQNSSKSLDQIKTAQQAQFSPYITINPVSATSTEKNKIVLDVVLKNIGQVPALQILKEYKSSLRDIHGKYDADRSFNEEATNEEFDALAPTQESAHHKMDINIDGFDPQKHEAIRIKLRITYVGLDKIDKRRCFSEALFILFPKAILDERLVFQINQPKLRYGFVDGK